MAFWQHDQKCSGFYRCTNPLFQQVNLQGFITTKERKNNVHLHYRDVFTTTLTQRPNLASTTASPPLVPPDGTASPMKNSRQKTFNLNLRKLRPYFQFRGNSGNKRIISYIQNADIPQETGLISSKSQCHRGKWCGEWGGEGLF